LDKLNIQKLKLARIKSGYSISELAKLSKVSRNTITLIEQEKVVPRTYILGRISKVLGVPIQEVLAE
jgi:putative transcriptional regulator